MEVWRLLLHDDSIRRMSWKIITKNFIKPPKFKNQLIVIQAACKNKSVVSKIRAIKKAAIAAA